MKEPKLSRRGLLRGLFSGAALAALSKQSLAGVLLCSEEKTTSLQWQVQEYLDYLWQEGILARDETVACSVYDLLQGENLVSLNEDMPLQCASMFKPFLVLAYLQEVSERRKVFDASVSRELDLIISRSDNSLTDEYISWLRDPANVERILRKNYGDIFRELELVEYIPVDPPNEGKTYLNKASAGDYRRFLTGLWEERFPYSRYLFELMAKRGAADRIDQHTPEMLVANKTGSTGHLCGDMGIVQGWDKQGKPLAYTFVAIIESESLHEKREYVPWISSRARVIRDLSSMVYEELQKSL